MLQCDEAFLTLVLEAPRSLFALVAGHGRWALESKSVRTALPRVWDHHEGRAAGLLVWPTGPLVEMPQQPVWSLFADSGPDDRNQSHTGADFPVVAAQLVTERALRRDGAKSMSASKGGHVMRLRMRTLPKKHLPCLRCGKILWTDAAHRFCRKCRRHNSEVYDTPTYSFVGDIGELAN